MHVPSQADFIVVGSGIAGLRAAIELSGAGRVLVVSKQELQESNTRYAQGGIAVALSEEDDVALHYEDTLAAGDGLVDPEAAKVLVTDGPLRVRELIEWGTDFDREGASLLFTREGAHSRSRILHAHGDSTGREIARALLAKARTLSNVHLCDFRMTTDLVVEDGRVGGLSVLDAQDRLHTIRARAVLLATGGAGQVYSDTTNPPVATGDGIAMAWRAGAAVADMEFFQFHPTALSLPGAPRFLLSEALRGEGAWLRNDRGERFMLGQHPLAELAPRDVVARAITRQGLAGSAVYLDLRHLAGRALAARFPSIFETCLHYGLDLGRDLLPVRPAAHYLMGGVRTDLDGRTSLAGLYAAGEVACTGVHGANRLASNSLLEGLVFGARAAHAMAAETRAPVRGTHAAPAGTNAGAGEDIRAASGIARIQSLMWRHAGLLRDRAGLDAAGRELSSIDAELPPGGSRSTWEARNLQTVATLIVRSAAARLESRGAHFREDFPRRDDARFRRHSVVDRAGLHFEESVDPRPTAHA